MISARTKSNTLIEFPRIFNGYEIISFESNGPSSVVFKVKENSSNAKRAAIVIPKRDLINKNQLNNKNNEITIHLALNHPNIVRVYDAFEITNHKKEELIVIIKEYCSKGSLSSYIEKNGLKDKFIRTKIENGLLQAVLYLQGTGFVHHAINSQNVLIDKNLNVKLNNFSCCEFCQDVNSTQFKDDLWSIGSIFYTLSEGKPLTNPIYDDDGCLHVRIEDRKCKELIEKCTYRDVNKIPSIEELLYIFTTHDDEEKEVHNQELFKEDKKDSLSSSSFLNNCYTDLSIDYGCKNDIKQSKYCKKNTKKSRRKNSQKKQESKIKSKNDQKKARNQKQEEYYFI